MLNKIIASVKARLKAYQLNADARKTLIYHVEDILREHGIKRHAQTYPNPREYRKPAESALLDKVQTELEEIGFKFKRLPIHTMDTRAVESAGRYRSVDYILDLVFNHDELEVDLYF